MLEGAKKKIKSKKFFFSFCANFLPTPPPWTLWLYTNNKAKSWDENLQKVISFNVVEDFWAVYNHIQLASKLNAGHDYALFRAGTRPAWEDEANKVGGRWVISLPSKHYRKNDLVLLVIIN